jgi:hypothetical protein
MGKETKERLIIELAKLTVETYKEKRNCEPGYEFATEVYFADAIKMLVDVVEGREPNPQYLIERLKEIERFKEIS